MDLLGLIKAIRCADHQKSLSVLARLETLLEQEAIQEPVGGWELLSPCMEHLDASLYIYIYIHMTLT